jgi:hypothetical protein
MKDLKKAMEKRGRGADDDPVESAAAPPVPSRAPRAYHTQRPTPQRERDADACAHKDVCIHIHIHIHPRNPVARVCAAAYVAHARLRGAAMLLYDGSGRCLGTPVAHLTISLSLSHTHTHTR